MLVFSDEPVARRHSSQWQYKRARGSPLISYWTDPQRQ
jgi:hypothetical protein